MGKNKFRSKLNKWEYSPKVKQQLSASNTQAYKKFGQNFLIDTKYVDFMIGNLDINKGDFIIEIGPGMGALTSAVLKKIELNRYLALEIDSEKVAHLKQQFPDINIQNISILDFDVETFCRENNIHSYKILGSLPFNISKKIIQNFSECGFRPLKAVFMVQKEVGDNFIAKDGTTFLSLYISQYWNILDTKLVPSKAFFPQPKVDGMILIMAPENNGNRKFVKFAKRGFGHPRKKLGNVLNLPSDNLFYNKRAHEISGEEWQSLFKLETEIK